jgi:hypothetical protein
VRPQGRTLCRCVDMPTSLRTRDVHERRLRLAAHVRACRIDGQVILLDLSKNKYLGIDDSRLPALADAVGGWPAWATPQVPSDSGAAIDKLTAPLLQRGLLSYESTERSLAADVQEATASLNAEEAMRTARLGPRRIQRLLWGATCAAMKLRYRSLFAIAAGVAARRARHTRTPNIPPIERLREAVAAYMRMRPFVLSAHDRCLNDSLTLLHFLAAEGAFPRWVIGVRTRPFGAHSWVQMDGVVLNDQHEHVRQYRPILVV